MGVLKLSILDVRDNQYKTKMKKSVKNDKSFHVGNCSCPCWAFIKKNEVVMDDIQSVGSWNID